MKAAATLVLLLLSATQSATAAEKKLTGAQISLLLTGNSVHGIWASTEYKSYFSTDGTTIYHAKGRDPDQGRWRTTDSQYCSTWRDVEKCYDIYQDGNTLIWFVPETGKRYSSTVTKGLDTDF